MYTSISEYKYACIYIYKYVYICVFVCVCVTLIAFNITCSPHRFLQLEEQMVAVLEEEQHLYVE